MKRKLSLIASLILSSNSFASCGTIATTTNQGIHYESGEPVYGHNEYIIQNDTAVLQHYDICMLISVQFFDNTHQVVNRFCDSVNLAPGQSTGRVMKDPFVNVKYPASRYRYHASIDSITDVMGECRSSAHTIKKLLLYER